MNQMTINHITIFSHPTREAMGQSVAIDVKVQIMELLKQKENITIVFASAPSQNEFLDALKSDTTIPWDRIICFHLDEYVGLSPESPQSFSYYLQEKLFQFHKPKQFHYLNGLNDPEMECQRYSELLALHPIDLACIGIGENGHIAFNDPHVANFSDPLQVKKVMLDEVSRLQQVNDNCFANLEEVPNMAISLTIPAILSASVIFCTVPGERKSKAVRDAVLGPLTIECPASVLRNAHDCRLYLDEESASLL
jgi:glucosamine-6-phosphate deaminase